MSSPSSDIQNLPFPVIGLTGGAASGKSTVARIFEENGIPSVDADRIGHTLIEPGGRAEKQVREAFGTTDRQALRKIIFSNPVKKKELESILHPLIREESFQKLQSEFEKRGEPPSFFALYEAALLIETGYDQKLDGLITVETKRELQRSRLFERPGITEEIAQGILDSQTNSATRRNAATYVLTNDRSIEDLNRQVKELIETIRSRIS